MSNTAIKIITIDGPSGVGKGTVANLIAKQLQFKILDSGALYRLAALHCITNKIDIEDSSQIKQITQNFNIRFEPPYIYLNEEEVASQIRTEAVAKVASKIAVFTEVRNNLFQLMQNFATPPGLVADGRDMGTVVFPHADLKIFLTASNQIRAKRRYKQLREQRKNVTMQDVFSQLEERDKRDSNRLVAPLKPALDAVVIDTDHLTILQVFKTIEEQAIRTGIVPLLT